MNLPDPKNSRVLLAGATGTIGQAVARALVMRGFKVTAIVRAHADVSNLPADINIWRGDVTNLKIDEAVHSDFDVVISCLASRSGVKADAWLIDHQANMNLLNYAEARGAKQFILLSAICVQRPKLEFQRAKLAFEAALAKSKIDWTIVRPTAFFKSLSGQVQKVMDGKNFLVFGDGEITACKPISDRDLANFIVDQIGNEKTSNKILPVGGPGAAIAPIDQANFLFELLGEQPRIKRVPLKMMDVIVAALTMAARLFPRFEEKAEYARIGRYYASESMLVYDAEKEAYDADATPSYGSDTLFEHYKNLVSSKSSI